MREQAVLFGESSLVGIVTEPPVDRPAAMLAVILLNPGIVHRVGPGRIYVKIARALAATMGIVVLRFDFSSVGDSPARRDNLQFEKSAIKETQNAMDYLEASRGIQHFVLLGGCSGAAVSLNAAGCDARVRGALLINFPVEHGDETDADESSRARSHYYRKVALFSLKSWRKLITGKADYKRILQTVEFQAKRRLAPRQSVSPELIAFRTKLRKLAANGVHLTFLCSQGDPALEELREAGGRDLKQLRAAGKVSVETIPGCDHTFSALQDHQRLLEVILKHADAFCATRIEACRATAPSSAEERVLN